MKTVSKYFRGGGGADSFMLILFQMYDYKFDNILIVLNYDKCSK